MLLKNVQQMVTPTNHVIARAEYTLRSAPGTLGIFETSSCRMQVKTKKVLAYHLSEGPLALLHTVNPALVIALCS